MSLLSSIKQWIDGADWRSWVAHSVVAVAVALVSHAVGFHAEATTWAVFTLFFCREAEQILLAFIYNQPRHWVDGVNDFVWPTIAAALVSVVL